MAMGKRIHISNVCEKKKKSKIQILNEIAAPFVQNSKERNCVASDVNSLCVNINVQMKIFLRNNFFSGNSGH